MTARGQHDDDAGDVMATSYPHASHSYPDFPSLPPLTLIGASWSHDPSLFSFLLLTLSQLRLGRLSLFGADVQCVYGCVCALYTYGMCASVESVGVYDELKGQRARMPDTT